MWNRNHTNTSMFFLSKNWAVQFGSEIFFLFVLVFVVDV